MKRLMLIPLLGICFSLKAQTNQFSLSVGGSTNTQPSHYKFLEAEAALVPAASLKYGRAMGHGLRIGGELSITQWKNRAKLIQTNPGGAEREDVFRYVYANPALSIGAFISKEFQLRRAVLSIAPSVGYVAVLNTNGLKYKDGYPVSNGMGKGNGFYAGAKLSWLYKINQQLSLGPELNVRYAAVSTAAEGVTGRVNYHIFYFPVMAQVAYNL